MSRLLLVCRLAARDLRWRPAQAVLLLLAIVAATATLALGLALNGVASRPYQQTRAATDGPDVVAQLAGQSARPATAAPSRAQVKGLIRRPGVTSYSGPYAVGSAVLRTHGLSAGVEAEERGPGPAQVDQPKLTAGRWMGAGGIVLERTFAAALGVGVGDRVTLSGRPFLVTGIAVTAAETPYPNLCYVSCDFALNDKSLTPSDIGLAWITVATARALASPQAPLFYLMNLRLEHPSQAQALVNAYDNRTAAPANGPWLYSWQQLQSADGLLVQDEQQVLSPGAWLAGLLAVASVAVLAGGRMAERTRRVGLLKAVGGTPELVTAVLLAENLILAVLAAAAGLVIGWLVAPLITSPGAGLIGTAGAPSLTPAAVGLVVAVALAVAFASTLGPAIRAARTSTVSALDNASRPPRRRPRLIAISARLPVPLLLGLRMAARRPWRAALGAASVAVTVTGIVAVLAFRATIGSKTYGPDGLNNPVVSRDGQMVLVLTVVLVALAVLNAVFTAWATVLDTRRPSALNRALGASPRQVGSGLAVAQMLPALPGALAGIPLGIGLFAVANSGGVVTVPPAWELAVVVVATVLTVAGLTSIPAGIGVRRSPAEVLAVETA